MISALRRLATTLALALSLLGCAPTGEPVKLMTLNVTAFAACCIPCVVGVLLPDDEIGTVIRVDAEAGDFGGCGLDPTRATPIGTRTEPVAWSPGDTGRRLDSGQVVVVNRWGAVVARTGERYVCQQEAASKAYLCETGE